MKKQKILIIMLMLSLAMCLNACGKKTGSDAQEEAGGAETVENAGTAGGDADKVFSIYGRYEAVFVMDDEDEMYEGEDEYLILDEDGTLELFLVDEPEYLTYELDGDEIIVDGETIGWYEEGTVAFDIGDGWTIFFAQEGAAPNQK